MREKEQTSIIIGIFGSALFSLFICFLFYRSKSKFTFTVLPKNKSHTQSVKIKEARYGVLL